MHCEKKITEDLFWVGADDRRLALFEGVYAVPKGVSYNSYLLVDEKTVLIDTADKSVRDRFLENVAAVLNGRPLDYLIIQHMEPDHSSSVQNILAFYPDVKIICNAKTKTMLSQFYLVNTEAFVQVVEEGDVLNTGRHQLHFVMAPMVHWPEVMLTYDASSKTLFSADAFGCFGATNGALFADEINFTQDYMDEARRYYTNIVGKYGQQVQAVLSKASKIEIERICPLHGFVWRGNFVDIFDKYDKWSRYEPEERGVMIVYASVYGNTENAAEILSVKLREQGVKTVMYDVSVTPAPEIVSAAFKWSHFVFASTTYNAGIFVMMEKFLRDLTSHNIQNRAVALVENGSWAATSGGLMKDVFASSKNIRFIDKPVSIKSSVKERQYDELCQLAESIKNDILPKKAEQAEPDKVKTVDPNAMFKISYGLYVLSAKDGDKDNGCIINTAAQLTAEPLRVSVTVSKKNFTHDMIAKTCLFNVSVLSENVPFSVFEHYGFKSGRDSEKISQKDETARTQNGLAYLSEWTNAAISCKVIQTLDLGTHSMFIADVTQTVQLSDKPSVTYQYYFNRIKPKPPSASHKNGYVCKICGYVLEGNDLPDDFICPLCKHTAADFEKIK